MQNAYQKLGLMCLFVAASLSVAHSAAAAEPAGRKLEPSAASAIADAQFRANVGNVVRKYCVNCHGAEKPKAGLQLHEFNSEAAIAQNRRTWENVLEMVRTRQMPPEKQPRPSGAEILRMTDWLQDALSHVDCDGGGDPGRVTVRRLNRNEYNNTIRDLVGVSFRPADDFPSDDVGYGFDNIGDVLSLPPLLLEKYLAAAEQIAQAAIVDPGAITGPVAKFAAGALPNKGPSNQHGDGRNFYSNGELWHDFEFSRAGKYTIRVRAYGEQAGDEPARMSVRLDGKELHLFDVTAEEGEAADYAISRPMQAGKQRVSVAFTNDFYDPKAADPAQRDRNLVVESLEIEGPLGPPELPESHRRIIFRRPAHEREVADCAKAVLERFATRAFRRPVHNEELEGLVRIARAVIADGEPFEKGIRVAVQAVLVSPQFLFRVELDPPSAQPGTVYSLTEYELATRLSYFLWSSLPDDELIRLAGQKRLRANLDAQVRRMLRDPKSQALVDNFAGQWLQLRSLQTVSPDPKLFASFDDALRTAMRTETELFFEAIMREDRSILEFLSADFTFVNERLARHYGLPGVRGEEFQRVALDGAQRGGILSHASILTITSNPTRTSPVKRGKWVLENLLGTPPPPPPPGVPELPTGKSAELTGSLRERMEQHRTNPSCAACHQRMDPLGFGLENFDAIGAWRTHDGEHRIDPTGRLPSGQSFRTPAELRQILVERKGEFCRCLAEKMLTYGLGRGLENYDQCAVDRIVQALEVGGHRFSTLILEVVHSEAFQKRRAAP